jgi:hypothetical protein
MNIELTFTGFFTLWLGLENQSLPHLRKSRKQKALLPPGLFVLPVSGSSAICKIIRSGQDILLHYLLHFCRFFKYRVVRQLLKDVKPFFRSFEFLEIVLCQGVIDRVIIDAFKDIDWNCQLWHLFAQISR